MLCDIADALVYASSWQLLFTAVVCGLALCGIATLALVTVGEIRDSMRHKRRVRCVRRSYNPPLTFRR
jgi:hypothetical protein